MMRLNLLHIYDTILLHGQDAQNLGNVADLIVTSEIKQYNCFQKYFLINSYWKAKSNKPKETQRKPKKTKENQRKPKKTKEN